MDIDENGWALGHVVLLSPSRAFTLIDSNDAARVDVARWAHQARRFFGVSLEVFPAKKYSGDRTPDADAMEVEIERGGSRSRVLVVTVPAREAVEALRAAEEAVRAIGGAGMDVLVARGRRVWQVDAAASDRTTPLTIAAILASILLAPIVPPEGGAIYGVKGARERLAQLESAQ